MASTAAGVVGCVSGIAALVINILDNRNIRRRLKDLELDGHHKTASAFVTVGSAAVTDELKVQLRRRLKDYGIQLISEGSISAKTFYKAELKNSSVGQITRFATKIDPVDLSVSATAQDDFQDLFKLKWEDSVKKKLVFHADEAVTKLRITNDAMEEKWSKLIQGINMLKLDSGLYVGKIDSIYVINGFYLQMKKAFQRPDVCLYYFEAKWPLDRLSWEDFSDLMVSTTDSHTAWALQSLQHVWGGEKSICVSTSPLATMVDRVSWFDDDVTDDAFGKALRHNNIPLKTIKAWGENPVVKFNGKKEPILKFVEKMPPSQCLAKCVEIYEAQKDKEIDKDKKP